MINSALRAAVTDAKGKAPEDKPLTASTLRKILREELRASSRAICQGRLFNI
jgi:hypothetical protein